MHRIAQLNMEGKARLIDDRFHHPQSVADTDLVEMIPWRDQCRLFFPAHHVPHSRMITAAAVRRARPNRERLSPLM